MSHNNDESNVLAKTVKSNKPFRSVVQSNETPETVYVSDAPSEIIDEPCAAPGAVHESVTALETVVVSESAIDEDAFPDSDANASNARIAAPSDFIDHNSVQNVQVMSVGRPKRDRRRKVKRLDFDYSFDDNDDANDDDEDDIYDDEGVETSEATEDVWRVKEKEPRRLNSYAVDGLPGRVRRAKGRKELISDDEKGGEQEQGEEEEDEESKSEFERRWNVLYTLKKATTSEVDDDDDQDFVFLCKFCPYETKFKGFMKKHFSAHGKRWKRTCMV